MLRRRAKAPRFLALNAASLVCSVEPISVDEPKGVGDLLGKGSYGKVYRSKRREEDAAINFTRCSVAVSPKTLKILCTAALTQCQQIRFKNPSCATVINSLSAISLSISNSECVFK